MNSTCHARLISAMFICILLAAGLTQAQPSANVSVFATGLDNPCGLKFGPDGELYVAEGGTGGTQSTTEAQCPQVPEAGPYTGGFTARISKISADATRTTVVDGLPSSQTNPDIGSLVSGVADVAFIGDALYAILAGAGCSHGLAGTVNAVIRVDGNGTATQVADLSTFQMQHPVANPEPEDFEPDGTWYSMVTVGGNLYAVEPNHGELDQITPGGTVSRVSDISATQGHIVPAALTFHLGRFYVGNLHTFPVTPGLAGIYRITPCGTITKPVSGLTAVLGVAFKHGRLYVPETTTVAGPPTPGTGKVVRVTHTGTLETVAEGLTFPTAMTVGPDGQLYVSNYQHARPEFGQARIHGGLNLPQRGLGGLQAPFLDPSHDLFTQFPSTACKIERTRGHGEAPFFRVYRSLYSSAFRLHAKRLRTTLTGTPVHEGH